jgi:hypothetical protein
VNIGFIIEPRCRRKHLERPRKVEHFGTIVDIYTSVNR